MLVFLPGTVCTAAAGRIFVDADVTGPEIHQDYVPDEIIVKFKNNAAKTLEEKILAGSDAAQLELSGSLDKLNKKFRLHNVKPVFKNFKAHRRRLNALLKKDKALLTKREKRILQRLKRAGEKAAAPALDRIYKLQLDLEPDQSIQQVLAAYNRDRSVEYAELNYIVSVCKAPDDPLYPLQWPLNNIGQDYPESGYYNPPPGTPDCDIDAPEAWDIHTGSSKVIVAVVDSGVDYRHRELQGNIWVNQTELNGAADVDDDDNGYIDDIFGYDFINNDGDPIDDLGHGTHCSGIIAAEGNNGFDIAGVCWDAKIMSLKFLDAEGEGNTSDAAVAFYYAVENDADVISSSWGGDDYSETLEKAIDYAHSQGVIMVAAAGNDNSDSAHYPAYYEHMIAVAATNSNDAKASFSNYGDWVDIAAPGVDILSLRAAGTSRGTPYDSNTTVASGTSMACPHVAGACALLLSFNATLTSDEVNDVLMETGDPISPGICVSDGRLNLFNAMLAAVPSRGNISLEHDVYSCSSVVSILLLDCDIKGQGNQAVTLTAGGGDTETVLLTEGAPAIGVFTGTIPTASGAPNIEDGTLQLLHGEIITATYQDQDDGTGNPAAAADTALADCESPEIFNVQIDVPGPEPTVIFKTNEPSMTRVLCGLACGGPYIIEGSYPILATSHTIKLIGVSPRTDYFFIVEAIDVAGNESVDDNAGDCFAFTTDEGPRDIFVPRQYSTIQEAIKRSWNGGTVRVADGTYTGQGNRDIDFLGKAITVRSENGPESCIIDCNGTQDEPHRGFYIHSAEDGNSIIDGFTIANGYAPKDYGGGIYCRDSSPTVTNCTFSGNSADFGGGGMRNYNSSPAITNCTFSENSADFGAGMYNSADSSPKLTNCNFRANTASGTFGAGGGMANQLSSTELIHCTFTNNTASSGGGGAIANQLCSPTLMLTNCIFSGNSTGQDGGGMRNYRSSPTLTNCIFTGNSAVDDGGGMYNYSYSSPTLTNCTFSDNSADYGGGMDNLRYNNPTLTNCTFSNNLARYGGAISNRHYSKPRLTNCTFSGNSADYSGGGINNDRGRPTLTNCTFAANSAPNGSALACDSRHQLSPSKLQLSNCILWDGGDETEARCESGKMPDRRLAKQGGFASEIWNNDGSTITINYSDVQGGQMAVYDPCEGLVWGEGNIDADPLFVDANNGDYRLSAGSPCIDAGMDAGVYEDIEGNIRPFDFPGVDNNGELPDFDMGAHEAVATTQGKLIMLPRTINRSRKGQKILALIHLPEPIVKDDIDAYKPLVLYPGAIEAAGQYIIPPGRRAQSNVRILAVFDKADLLTPLVRFAKQSSGDDGNVELTIVGRFITGQYFYGTDEIRIISYSDDGDDD